MGNKIGTKTSFDIINTSELKEFLSSINFLDGFFMDTNLSISSKCLVIINNLINHLSLSNIDGDDLHNYQRCDIFPGVSIQFDKESMDKIEKLKFNCQLIRHLSIFNSNFNTVEEFIELNNFHNLSSLHLENLPIKFVQHLKFHRKTLLKLCAHNCISDLDSLIELCGGDQSFSGDWSNLLHLDIRFNKLRSIDKSVMLLSNLTVLDASRNDLHSFEFVEKIPTLVCLNVSYNCIKKLPTIRNHCLKVLIIGYNYLEGLEEIKNFKLLSTLNVSYNMISTTTHLLQLNELDFLKDLIIKGNPICSSDQYRLSVLSVVSTRVVVDFALDGRIFSKKERNSLHKIPVIVIEPASNLNPILRRQVPILKPGRRDLLNAGDNTPGSVQRRLTNLIKINDQNENTDEFVSSDFKSCTEDLNKPPTPREKRIISISGTDCDTTTNNTLDASADPLSPVKTDPFYFGEKTSNLICLSSHSRTSFMKVSLQIMEQRFMAVNEKCITVDNINLWTLLLSIPGDGMKPKILTLIFFDETSQEENSQMGLLNRSLEFNTAEQLENFIENLYIYLKDFTISFDKDSINSLTKAVLICSNCQSSFKCEQKAFKYKNCTSCGKTEFFLKCPPVPVKINTQVVNKNIATPTPVQSPAKMKQFSKQETSSYVIKAFKENTVAYSPSTGGTSFENSYYTANDESNKTGNNSDRSSQNLSLSHEIETREYQSIMNLDDPVGDMDKLLENVVSIVPKDPNEDPSITFLKKIKTQDWIIHYPLSNVSVYMNNITKIDDRVNLHFLTNILSDKEDFKAAFKSNLIFKSMSHIAVDVLVVLSSDRIWFYSWTDKDSLALDECLKLIIVCKLKNLIQIDDCLNHQWINMRFKKNPPLVLIFGDIAATKHVIQVLTETASNIASTLRICPIKDIHDMKSNSILEDIFQALNGDVTCVDALQDCEYYLFKSCSGITDMFNPGSGYAPKMIGIHSDHLFLINIKFPNKSNELRFHLCQVISFHILLNEVMIDNENKQLCRLFIFENNVKKSIDIEFWSPAMRSQALISISNMWKQLCQLNLNFKLVDFSNC